MKTDKFLVNEGTKLNLKKHATDFTADYTDKKKAAEDLQKNVEKIRELQEILFAEGAQSLLIVFQAMDAAGKDSTIEHVFSGVNPQGCHVVGFKQPSAEELAHDFLWRCQKALPERGKIGIFNRSHYEEVLVVKVHPEYLGAQRLPTSPDKDKKFWSKRYEQIRDWESMLAANGTQIIKFFLNVSREEQKERFIARIDEPAKNWKFSMGDVKERALWDDYMKAYTDAISATSTKDASWYVIPADKKWFMRLAVSEIIVEKLKAMKPAFPTVSEEHKAELAEAKKALEAEA
ncbi:MAG TPA: polyphosphate kinase 2 family protein [Pyrinomonadaceae bacterium]|nr:polyphosphate kinase 2 family protein [Pyrinomonadaceae bacterium]